MLTSDELERYDRQIMISGFGKKGQERLKRSTVFIAGAGGLGSPAAIYLAAAGIGVIRIADHDKVERSNLNRQILHGNNDIGKNKADSAEESLKDLYPFVKIHAILETITEGNVSRLVSGSDLIVDAMDNLPIRYILNRAALKHRIPFFHGAVNGFEGRVTTIIPGETACLRCLYRKPVPSEKFPIIGVIPAVIAGIQAAEVIKYILKSGRLLTNRLLMYDGLNLKFEEFKIKKNPQCDHCGKKISGE